MKNHEMMQAKGEKDMTKEFNIYCDGHLWLTTNDILRAVKECRNMMVCGIERECITVLNESGHLINLQF